MEQLAQENKVLKDKYYTLNQNYNNVKADYDKMVERIAQIEKQIPASPAISEENSTSNTPIDKEEILTMKDDALNASRSISQLQDFFSYVDNQLGEFANRIDEMDQYMKRNSLKIRGLTDVPANTYGVEFSKYVLEKLQSLLPTIADQININDIDVSHPLPTKNKSQSVVIVKFVRRDIKNLVFFEKRELKKSPLKVSIFEHLTNRNIWLMNEAKKLVGFKQVWSSQCTVFALVNGRKVPIRSKNDLHYVQQALAKNTYASATNATADLAGPGTASSSEHQSVVFTDPRNKNAGSIVNTLLQLSKNNSADNSNST